MTIFLVQHGEAKTKDEDPERALTDSGIRTTKKVASWLGRHIIDIGQICHSGKTRAAQTAEIFAGRLAAANGVKAVAGLHPNDDVNGFAGFVEEQQGLIMVVGHLPFLDRFAGFLVTGDQNHGVVSFVNSGVVCLKKNTGGWSVSWAVTPELLADV